MRAMKDSGIEWIGEIPEGWESLYAFQCFYQVKNKNEGLAETNLLSLSYGKLKRKSMDTSEGLLPESFETYNIIEADDIVLRLTDLQNDHTSLRVGLSGEKGIITSAYITLRNYSKSIPKYLYYYLHSFDVAKGFYGMGAGVRQGLNWEELKHLQLLCPPAEEQPRIVAHLDRQCVHIDNIIEKTKASIEEYKKLRQAVITQAVTKGVRGDRPMKDSDIEWIGEIPEGWEFVKITRILKENHPYPIGDGDHGLIKTEDYQDSGIPYLRVQNLGWGTPLQVDNVVYISEERNEQIKNSILRPNDVLFAKTGATIGKTGIIPEDLPISNTTSHIGKITVSDKYSAKFVFYFLSSKIGFRQFWEIAIQKTTRPELSIEETKSIRILLPDTYEEQAEIAAFLDEKCRDIDSIIDKKEQFLSDLEAYKKSLIYEYVTGKKEVPQP